MRCGLEIDRDTGNIIREGCGSCVVKVWVETNSHTGAGHYREPIKPEQRTGIDSAIKPKPDMKPTPRDNK